MEMDAVFAECLLARQLKWLMVRSFYILSKLVLLKFPSFYFQLFYIAFSNLPFFVFCFNADSLFYLIRHFGGLLRNPFDRFVMRRIISNVLFAKYYSSLIKVLTVVVCRGFIW